MNDNDKEEAIRRTFNILDRDKDGNIDTKELERFILNQGMNIPQEELQQLIEKIDTNQDGKIQLSEFESIMHKMLNNEDDETICRQIFTSIDRKSDNFITADELKYAFYCLGEMLTEEEARHLIQFASNGKDSVNYENFIKIFRESQNPSDRYDRL
jgi:Ca2+-binding EF-hand superfamily protein